MKGRKMKKDKNKIVPDVKRRSKAGKFSAMRTRTSDLGNLKYDSKPSVIMASKVSGHPPNRADAEMSRLMAGDVFRSAEKTIKQTNSNSRRNA